MSSKELKRYMGFVIERMKEKVCAGLRFILWILKWYLLCLSDSCSTRYGRCLLTWIVGRSVPASRQRWGPTEDAILCSSPHGLGNDGTEDIKWSLQVTGGDAQRCGHSLSQRDDLFWWYVSVFATSHNYIDINILILLRIMSNEVLMWLSVWNEVHIVCIWSSWCHCIQKTHYLLPRLNPDWYWLT